MVIGVIIAIASLAFGLLTFISWLLGYLADQSQRSEREPLIDSEHGLSTERRENNFRREGEREIEIFQERLRISKPLEYQAGFTEQHPSVDLILYYIEHARIQQL